VDEGAELAAEVGRVAHGAVPVADNGLGDQSGEVVVVLPADTLDGNGDVGGGDGVVTDTDLGTDKVGLLLLGVGNGLGGRSWGSHGDVAEVLLGELDELVVGNTTRANEDHAVGSVVGLDVVGEVVTGDGLDVLLGAEDGATKGLVHEGGGVQVVEDDLLELFVNLLLLAKNDVALTLDGLGLELGVLENVGEDVDRVGHVRVERLGVVDGVLALWALLDGG
jgi:hypothetical protein